MKIVVLSDTHGDANLIEQVYEQELDADAFFHCGDSELAYDDAIFIICIVSKEIVTLTAIS